MMKTIFILLLLLSIIVLTQAGRVPGFKKKKHRSRTTEKTVEYKIIHQVITDSRTYSFRETEDDSMVNVNDFLFNMTRQKDGITFGNDYVIYFSNFNQLTTPIVFDHYLNKNNQYVKELYPKLSEDDYQKKIIASSKVANNYDCKGGIMMLYTDDFTCITESKSTVTFDHVCINIGYYGCWSGKKTFNVEYKDGNSIIILTKRYKIPKHNIYSKSLFRFLSHVIFNVWSGWDLKDL